MKSQFISVEERTPGLVGRGRVGRFIERPMTKHTFKEKENVVKKMMSKLIELFNAS